MKARAHYSVELNNRAIADHIHVSGDRFSEDIAFDRAQSGPTRLNAGLRAPDRVLDPTARVQREADIDTSADTQVANRRQRRHGEQDWDVQRGDARTGVRYSVLCCGPATTFDPAIATGAEIPIEQRASEEITDGFGMQTAPAGAAVYNPAFDVTPAELVAAIITDRGVVQPVNSDTISAMIQEQ